MTNLVFGVFYVLASLHLVCRAIGARGWPKFNPWVCLIPGSIAFWLSVQLVLQPTDQHLKTATLPFLVTTCMLVYYSWTMRRVEKCDHIVGFWLKNGKWTYHNGPLTKDVDPLFSTRLFLHGQSRRPISVPLGEMYIVYGKMWIVAQSPDEAGSLAVDPLLFQKLCDNILNTFESLLLREWQKGITPHQVVARIDALASLLPGVVLSWEERPAIYILGRKEPVKACQL